MPSILSANISAALEHSLQRHPDEVAIANYLFESAEELLRLVRGDEPGRRVLMIMVMSILQDYDELLAMWVLDLGDGATKLARPLYEKALTFAYLAAHPAEIKDFTDYSRVHWYKVLAEGAIASPEGENWMAPEDRERINREYAEVKDRYRTTDCRKCNTQKMMTSWTKKGTPELAKDTHSVFRGMYFNGFLAPTLTIHPTFATMATQCHLAGDNKISFNPEVLEQDKEAAFGVAIGMLFATIVTMDEFFSLGRRELVVEVEKTFRDFLKTHPFGPSSAEARGGY